VESELKGIVSEAEKVGLLCEYLFNYRVIEGNNTSTRRDQSSRRRQHRVINRIVTWLAEVMSNLPPEITSFPISM
jgi:hypothetical protein